VSATSCAAALTIKRNGEFLLEILDDVLDISKIEAGKLEVHREPCPLLEIVGDVVGLMGVRAKAKRLPLVVNLRGPLPEAVLTDSTRVRQILINLLGNALKFTEAGEVRLCVRLIDRQSDEPRLRFDVIDTGIGMSPEQAEGLFRPFYQIDSPANRQYRGTGLGLAISRRLAEMLGGEISVTSTLGRGSTFTVTIATGPLDNVPLVENPTLEPPERRAGRRGSIGKLKLDCRILLAEDSPDNQRLISFMLRKAGADVEVAENGLAAFEKVRAAEPLSKRRARKTPKSTKSTKGKRSGARSKPRATAQTPFQPFDVVLMDIEMPVMDGRQAARRLREAGFDGPIIALTAHAMQHEIDLCLAAGCDAHVAKPIDWPTLVEMIHTQLKRRGRARTSGPTGSSTAQRRKAKATSSTRTTRKRAAKKPGGQARRSKDRG